MNCERHPNRQAVAQCNNCGAGICAECASKTGAAHESLGALCIDCYKTALSEVITDTAKKNRKIMTRIIISSIMYLFGLIMIVFAITEIMAGKSDGAPMLFVGIIICGFFTGLSWRKVMKETNDQYEREHGATYTITSDGSVYKEDGFWSKLICFLLGTAFGVIITPFTVIKNVINFKSNKNRISALKEEISTVS